MTVDALDMRCQACGIPARLKTLDFTYQFDELTILCHTCQGLIDAGMLRLDADENGRLCYRQWHFEWSPGELMPHVEQPS